MCVGCAGLFGRVHSPKRRAMTKRLLHEDTFHVQPDAKLVLKKKTAARTMTMLMAGAIAVCWLCLSANWMPSLTGDTPSHQSELLLATDQDKSEGNAALAQEDEEPQRPVDVINDTPTDEGMAMAGKFYTSRFAPDATSTTIIFNLFKGEPRALDMQLSVAFSQQNVEPPEVWVTCFNSPRQSEYESVVAKYRAIHGDRLVFTVSNFNHKFHGRFLLAYMAKTKYVLIVDDDIMIDTTTVADFQACMRLQRGVWGNFGHLRAVNFESYKSWPRVGYNLSEQEFAEQDYLSGMWFLEQSWLEYFAKERPPSWDTAEDMHLSHVMRKYLNLNTYGGKVALTTQNLPTKSHHATKGHWLDLRENIFDHQLGRGNKVADVDQPIDTLVYAESVADINDFVAKLDTCNDLEDKIAAQKRMLRGQQQDQEALDELIPPWCHAGKTAVVFRGAREQDVPRMIDAAMNLCAETACEYVSLKPKIRHPIKYFNMREGFGQQATDIPWQTGSSDVLLSLVGILNNVLPQHFFLPNVDHTVWGDSDETLQVKRNRLQIYHSTVKLALQIHASSRTNQKWYRRHRETSTDDSVSFPGAAMRVFQWERKPSTPEDTNPFMTDPPRPSDLFEELYVV